MAVAWVGLEQGLCEKSWAKSIQIPDLPLSSCVTVSKLVNLSEPLLSHLENKIDNLTYLHGVFVVLI